MKKREAKRTGNRTWSCWCQHSGCHVLFAHTTRSTTKLRWHCKTSTSTGLFIFHIVCDTYNEGPSIRAYEREVREETIKLDTRFLDHVNRASKLQPKHFYRHPSKRHSCFSFEMNGHFWLMLKFWKVIQTILASKKVDSCMKSTMETSKPRKWRNGRVHMKKPTADFIGKLCQARSQTVVFILLYHEKHSNVTIWMDTGTSSGNTRRLINISERAQNLTPPVCSAPPAFHAFSGCDYTAVFLRKAKARPYGLMVKNTEYISAFAQLGSSENVEPQVLATLEQFVCCMYGFYKATDVNDTRFVLFKKSYAPRNEDSPIEKIKYTDPWCLPPCKDVLQQKIKRANFVAHLWKNARQSNPIKVPALGHGWRLTDNNKLEFVWFKANRVQVNFAQSWKKMILMKKTMTKIIE